MTYIVDVSDNRNKIIASELEKRLLKVKFYPETAENGDTYIFSPAKKWNKAEAECLTNCTTVICGKISEEISEIFKHKQIKHINLMNDEIFTVKNANLTAEGVLSLLIEHSPKSMFENNVLILGAGRIAKALAILFSKLGINFSMVRYNKEKFPECYTFCDNCYLGEEFKKDIAKYDVIINTIPQVLFTLEDLEMFANDTVFIETASIDCLDRSKVKNFDFVPAPALPQRYCQVSAAKIMLESILGENNHV